MSDKQGWTRVEDARVKAINTLNEDLTCVNKILERLVDILEDHGRRLRVLEGQEMPLPDPPEVDDE